jgi:hypothetical protein
MTHHLGALRSRSLWALAALLACAGLALSATASHASVEQACNFDGKSFNACLNLDYRGYGWYNADVGVDVKLPAQYAREIVECGADPAASLWGDDGGGSADDYLRDFVLTPGWPSANALGFSMDLYTQSINSRELDEDDGQDEIYAKVSYWDCHTGGTRTFRTGTIRGEFYW